MPVDVQDLSKLKSPVRKFPASAGGSGYLFRVVCHLVPSAAGPTTNFSRPTPPGTKIHNTARGWSPSPTCCEEQFVKCGTVDSRPCINVVLA